MKILIKNAWQFIVICLLVACLPACKKGAQPAKTTTIVHTPTLTITLDNRLVDKVFPTPPTSASGTAGFAYNDQITTFDNSRWYPKWDEKNVFKVQLQHSQTDNPYTLRIGKGGQLYSIMTPIGEIEPPQNLDHAWIDDTNLLTSYQYDLQQPNSTGIDGLTPFIHQCGMYPNIDAAFQEGKQFWAPIVSDNWDAANNQYSTLSLGMISNGPAYSRGDVLMYQRTRDLGDGVFEITYIAYNYNTSYSGSPMNYVTDIAPWGGVRTSALPNMLLSNPDQTTTLSNIAYASTGYVVTSASTGGWAAATVDPTDQNSYTLATIFGSQNPSSTEKLFLYGTTDVARSFTVESVTYRQPLPPGKTFYCRQYYVLGKLSDVLPKATHYQQYAQSGFLNFDETTATTIPLYLDKENGQTMLSDEGTTPAFYVYAEPVTGSKPLYLIYETKTGQYHATCDPYNTMPRYPVLNDPQGRLGVRPYDGSTQILKLFGFVMPSAAANSALKYTTIKSVLTDNTFFTGKGIYDPGIMVRTTPN